MSPWNYSLKARMRWAQHIWNVTALGGPSGSTGMPAPAMPLPATARSLWGGPPSALRTRPRCAHVPSVLLLPRSTVSMTALWPLPPPALPATGGQQPLCKLASAISGMVSRMGGFCDLPWPLLRHPASSPRWKAGRTAGSSWTHTFHVRKHRV